MKIADWEQFGGNDFATTSLRHVLAHDGFVAPHTGEPFSEEMLFGIGGGIGAGYFVFNVSGTLTLVLGGRHLWTDHARYLEGICRRLNVPFTTMETGNARDAEGALEGVLAAGRPAIAWTDLASMTFLALPEELRGYFGYVCVVYGLGEAADIAGTSDAPVAMTPQELSGARGLITEHRHRLVVTQPPSPVRDLAGAVRSGIDACVGGMSRKAIRDSGLEAVERWTALVSDHKSTAGWPKSFPPGPALYACLSYTYFWLEVAGTGGGFYRSMYARFLDEAADVLARPALREVAERYRTLATLWSGLAEAALPSTAQPLERTKQLLREKDKYFSSQGLRGLIDMLRVQEELDDIAVATAERFPLDPAAIEALLADMRDRLPALHAGEADALRELSRAVR